MNVYKVDRGGGAEAPVHRGELSTLTIVTPAAAYLLPAARFPSLVWMICVGVMLPSARSSSAEVAATEYRRLIESPART